MPKTMQVDAQFAFQDWYAFSLVDGVIKTVASKNSIPINPNLIGRNISGVVYEDTTPLVNKTVRLYFKPTGELMGETISNALGEYSFNINIVDKYKYYIIAFDDMDNPVYQALALDDLQAQIDT